MKAVTLAKTTYFNMQFSISDIKRKMGGLKILAVILMIAAIILVVYSTYSNLNISKDGKSQNQENSQTNKNTQIRMQVNITEIIPEHITFLLSKMKAYELHNPLLSKNTPKIKTIVDGSVFSSEIKKGKISTVKSEISDEDIIIRTDKQTLADIINSDNVLVAVRQAISSGKIKIELVAGKTELFAKGYLSLYKEITGKSS